MTSKPSRGVSEAQIREAIVELVDNHQEPTTTKIRNLLGTGSFTTIGAVLTTMASRTGSCHAVTDPPDPRGRWPSIFVASGRKPVKSAADAHESERTGFRTARSHWEGERKELQTEISRLETLVAELDQHLDQRQISGTASSNEAWPSMKNSSASHMGTMSHAR